MRNFILFTLALFISGYSIAQEIPTVTTATKRSSGAMEKITTTTLKIGELTYHKIETIYNIDLRPDIFMGRIIVKSMEGKFNDIKKSISSNEKAIVGFDRDAFNERDQIRRKCYRAELYIDFDVEVFRKCITDVLTAKEISDLSIHDSCMNTGMVLTRKVELKLLNSA